MVTDGTLLVINDLLLVTDDVTLATNVVPSVISALLQIIDDVPFVTSVVPMVINVILLVTNAVPQVINVIRPVINSVPLATNENQNPLVFCDVPPINYHVPLVIDVVSPVTGGKTRIWVEFSSLDFFTSSNIIGIPIHFQFFTA